MSAIYESPLGLMLAGVAAALAVFFIRRGIRSFRLGHTEPDHPDQSLRVVQGFRGWIVGGSLLFVAGGLLFSATWPLLFAAVVLVEELIETGVMLAALRRQRRSETVRTGS